MRSRFRLITNCQGVTFLCFLIAGCTHEHWMNVEEATRLPSVAAPIIAPVNWVAKAGRAVTSKAPESSDTDRDKQFVLSRQIMDRFSSDGRFMDEILTLQRRFRSYDWGEITDEQFDKNVSLKAGEGTYGRYPTGNDTPAIIITDEGSVFKVRYEDEPAD